MPVHKIYQFYSELDYFKPKIWRRFEVTDDITIARLGYIVQVLFEMTASHLMVIEIPKGENLQRHLKKNFKGQDLKEHEAFILKLSHINGKPLIWRYEVRHEYRDWLGVEDFDTTAFDIDDMNFRLKKIPRIYKQCYEDQLSPTQKSIDLIERKYLKNRGNI